MARRQKGPTTEELLQKLDTRFTDYQTSNDEGLELFKGETKEIVERLENESKESAAKITEITSILTNLQEQNEKFDDQGLNFSKSFNESKETIANLETKLSEVEDGLKLLNERFDERVSNMEEKLLENTEDISNKINDNNEKLTSDIAGVKAELKKDIENVFKFVKEDQERNQTKFEEINKTLMNLNDTIQSKMEENFNLLLSRMENDAKNSESIKDGQDVELCALKEEVHAINVKVDDISEKLYEFEQNKKNNLLFYGIGSDTRETPESLVQKIILVMKTTLGMRREIPVIKASRLLTGPEIVGSRPVVVTFETFR